MIALAAAWSLVLLDRADVGPRWLHWTVALVALAAAMGVLVAGAMGWQHALVAAVAAGIVAGSTGTAAYTVATAATPHHGSIPNAVQGAGAPDGPGGPSMGSDENNTELAGLLAGAHTTWSAATSGSQSASSLEIASGTPVMAIGGWSGDPVPTLQQFIDYVHTGRIAYYVAGNRGGPGHGASAQQIADWVAQHYPATKVGGTTVYHLT
jgi:hypothetical protein